MDLASFEPGADHCEFVYGAEAKQCAGVVVRTPKAVQT